MLEVKATKSEYPKCERCWNHFSTCEYHKYFEDYLCKRCVDILVDMWDKGLWMKCPACLEWFYDETSSPENLNDNYICQECLKEMKNR